LPEQVFLSEDINKETRNLCRFLVSTINDKNGVMGFSLIINASTYKFWLTGGMIFVLVDPVSIWRHGN
jgi:hypothetical protein